MNVLGCGNQRRERSVGRANRRRGRHRDGVLIGHRPIELAEHAQEIAGGEGDADAIVEGAARGIEPVRLAAELPAGVAGGFDQLRGFLADDAVDREVRLAGAVAHAVLRSRQLDDAADRDGQRILAVLRPQVDLRADIEVADVIPSPRLVDARVPIENPAEVRVLDEQRFDVAVDAGVEEERSEDLRAILDAVPNRAGEVADVCVALDEVRAATIPANGPFAAREDFAGRHKPHTSVAEERRRRGSGLLRRGGRRGRWLRGGGALPRGCP